MFALLSLLPCKSCMPDNIVSTDFIQAVCVVYSPVLQFDSRKNILPQCSGSPTKTWRTCAVKSTHTYCVSSFNAGNEEPVQIEIWNPSYHPPMRMLSNNTHQPAQTEVWHPSYLHNQPTILCFKALLYNVLLCFSLCLLCSKKYSEKLQMFTSPLKDDLVF